MTTFSAFCVILFGLCASIWPGKGFEGTALAWVGLAIMLSDKL